MYIVNTPPLPNMVDTEIGRARFAIYEAHTPKLIKNVVRVKEKLNVKIPLVTFFLFRMFQLQIP